MIGPSLKDIEKNYTRLRPFINTTPILIKKFDEYGIEQDVVFKCELFQKTGTFKLRGVLSMLFNLSYNQRKKGVIAASGGNHGIAVAYAAKTNNINAKIVVPKTMNKYRYNKILSYGAEIVQTNHISEVIEIMNDIAEKENREVLHPFDNPLITIGTGSLGFEFMQQFPNLEDVIIPIGGGGLASGMACAIKQINPKVRIFGVEPIGANSMFKSFKENKATTCESKPESIADSLCAPYALPYSFSVCKEYIDDIVLVSDEELMDTMRLLFEELKLACEPACVAATAALKGPLSKVCKNRKVGVLLCGSNIDLQTFTNITNSGLMG